MILVNRRIFRNREERGGDKYSDGRRLSPSSCLVLILLFAYGMACATRPYARLPWILISWVITGLTISWALKHGEICARASSKSPATFAESTSKLGDSPTSRQCTPSPERAARLFKESNTRDSDKIGLHRYHLMYGPFLAPYLNKSMVSHIFRFCKLTVEAE